MQQQREQQKEWVAQQLQVCGAPRPPMQKEKKKKKKKKKRERERGVRG